MTKLIIIAALLIAAGAALAQSIGGMSGIGSGVGGASGGGGGCDGTIDLSTGCAQPMFGVL